MAKRASFSEIPSSDPQSTAPSESTSSAANETTPSPPSPAPQFALASNGRILVSAAELAGRDLSGREVFMGIYLTLEEQRDVLGFLDNAAADAAARMAAKLPRGGSGNSP